MKRIILRDAEYEVLQKVLRAVPEALLRWLLPKCDEVDIHEYRYLLDKVLSGDHQFPDTDDGMEEDAAWMYNTPDLHPDLSEWDLLPPTEYVED